MKRGIHVKQLLGQSKHTIHGVLPSNIKNRQQLLPALQHGGLWGREEQRTHRLARPCSPSWLPGGQPRAPSQILPLILLSAGGRDTTSHLSHGDKTVTILS